MDYEKVITNLNDILRRSDDNQGTIILSEKDENAIRESKVAVAKLLGYYPENFEEQK